MDILKYIFSSDFFPQSCFWWDLNTAHKWLNILGDFGIFSAYMVIPYRLLNFLKKQDPEFIKGRKTFISLFAAFISSCGISHLLNIIVRFYPFYYPQTYWLIWTAVISLFTAFHLKNINKLKVTSYKLFDKSVEVTEIELPPKKIEKDA